VLSCFLQAALKLRIIGTLCKVKKDGSHIHQLRMEQIVDVGLQGGQRDTDNATVDRITKKILAAPGIDLGPLLVVPLDRGLRPGEVLTALAQDGSNTLAVLNKH
jgi:hypothetical protein